MSLKIGSMVRRIGSCHNGTFSASQSIIEFYQITNDYNTHTAECTNVLFMF